MSVLEATAEPNYSHPARFSDDIIHEGFALLMKHGLDPTRAKLLDPFAGTGRVHLLRTINARIETVGVEIEPEWAACSPRTLVGTALDLPFEHSTFDAVFTSPVYGNRLADKDMRDSVGATYMKSLGRPASYGSSSHLAWGQSYREFHEQAWDEVVRVLKPGGLFLLNCKDHYRDKQVANVTAWHNAVLTGPDGGLVWMDATTVKAPGMRRGANHELRVEHEFLLLYKKPHLIVGAS